MQLSLKHSFRKGLQMAVEIHCYTSFPPYLFSCIYIVADLKLKKYIWFDQSIRPVLHIFSPGFYILA